MAPGVVLRHRLGPSRSRRSLEPSSAVRYLGGVGQGSRSMDPRYYGLVEMGFSGAVVLGFCFWQLRSVDREIRKTRESERSPSGDAHRGPGES